MAPVGLTAVHPLPPAHIQGLEALSGAPIRPADREFATLVSGGGAAVLAGPLRLRGAGSRHSEV